MSSQIRNLVAASGVLLASALGLGVASAAPGSLSAEEPSLAKDGGVTTLGTDGGHVDMCAGDSGHVTLSADGGHIDLASGDGGHVTLGGGDGGHIALGHDGGHIELGHDGGHAEAL